ncbi:MULTISPECIES: hypothetical protein [Leptospira]|uniref:Uncharacterized protein n=6 Tax=Leptospira santarosai TaxID=28183 RepID=A0A0G8BP30_9LEPT|nr:MULTISPECIES: hypothetical protein [Leptospira]EMO58879.1 hypothetical protein LEP1GSC161_3553 [Leptospira santarosai str. CBC1416]AIT10750.1 hypothetical protein LSS_22000 [Leptospira santarosai serovar Shermani str. LT 821]AVQ13483.1 Uncharacterized protein XB16_3188 [Leptospira santarosai]AVV49584.1 Uncharacterized protein XB17_00983 [Leptospira santarosai]AVV80025.1 Uncharacterized protein XB15_02274 [Leptospira santarosai]
MEKNLLLYQVSPTQLEENELSKRIRDRALGKEKFDFSPYSCFIEYKPADSITGVQYRDCVIDYTRCSNQKCIKKLI